MASHDYHIMVFPWLAFGHMIPFLELSKQLAEKGLRITFISTPRNIQRLPPIPQNLSGKIKLVEITLPTIDGLPENCEATIDLQEEQIQYLKKACDKLQAPFEEILANDVPDFILFDFVQCWIPEIAAKFDVGSAFFSAYTAATLAFLGPPEELKSCSRRTRPEDFENAPDWFTFPSLVGHRPHYSSRAFRNFSIPDKSGMCSGQRIARTVEGCNFVAVRSCREFEGEYLNLLEELYQRPSATFKWLDMQKSKTLVFVGFGSEYKMPLEQIHELAHGLELSQLPFIWVLRSPEGAQSFNLLPPGFLTRTSDLSLVSVGWAPQQRILDHPAIGACLFHSGWGSIIESLRCGHPPILMPMVADQDLNAKQLVEKGIGYEVPRNKDGSFSRDEVAKSLRLVMVEQEGEPFRLKATQMQSVFSSQELHQSYIDKFIEYLGNFKRKEHQMPNAQT
ncbi:Soyasaponin III rhamnosyltransferase [Bertholletia excelsa]